MKISVLMPSYNDSLSIAETLDSLVNQTYINWELIIINDGSTDNTRGVVKNYVLKHGLKDKIFYVEQSNTDQLKAILNGLHLTSGDIYYILHSDDLLFSNDVFEKIIKEFEKYSNVDCFIADSCIIQDNFISINRHKIFLPKKTNNFLANQLLWLGRNLLIDMAFWRKETFLTHVKENYLIWNMPHWIYYEGSSLYSINIKKTDFIFFKYRIHEGNYINNELGILNVLSGELRTAAQLMNYFHIPFYKTQYYVYRVFNKLKLNKIFKVYYKKMPTRNKAKIVRYIVEKRIEENVSDYFESIIKFYENISDRVIHFDVSIKGEKQYYGNSIKEFNIDLTSGKLSLFYLSFMDEMKKGFTIILVKNKKEQLFFENILKFFCINYDVTVKIKGKQ